MSGEQTRSADYWGRYEPTADAPWDLRRAVHLHRRAGFAATWSELQRDLTEGPEASIGRLLDGKSRPPGAPAPEEFERIAGVLGEAAVASSDSGRLKAWWFYRLLYSPDPLGERLTLMWHNHFATSIQKVSDPTAMRRQNDTLRRLARKPFGELLSAMVHDPALLIWLDAPANRKGHPNENLARELMELFTLGVGHFKESDVQETARALTGWSVGDGEFREAPSRHDDDAKTILGRSGKFGGPDVVKILLANPATADRLAWRLCDLFMGEGTVGKPERTALADGLRSHDLDIGWAVATILRSRALLRRVEHPEPGPESRRVRRRRRARTGIDRDAPQHARPGGLVGPPGPGPVQPAERRWLAGRPDLAVGSFADRPRAHFATALVEGRGVGRDTPLDPIALARHHGRGHDGAEALRFCAELLLGIVPDARWIDRLGASLGVKSKADWNEDTARRAVAQLLGSAEAQIG